MPILDILNYKKCTDAPLELQQIHRIVGNQPPDFFTLIPGGTEYHHMSHADALLRQRFHVMAHNVLPLASRTSSSSEFTKSPVPKAATHVVTTGGLKQDQLGIRSKRARNQDSAQGAGSAKGAGEASEVSNQVSKAMTASRKKPKNPAFDPSLFDARWWGCVDQLWIHLQHLSFDNFLMVHVLLYKHYTKKEISPLFVCVPIITETTRKALSLSLCSSTIVKAAAIQKTLSAFFPSSDGTFVNIHGNPKDTARKQYPAAHPYRRGFTSVWSNPLTLSELNSRFVVTDHRTLVRALNVL
jgi:hypothetical protein